MTATKTKAVSRARNPKAARLSRLAKSPKKAVSRARNPKEAMLLWNIPLPLRQRFKAKCAAEGRTMNAVVTGLLEKYVSRK